MTAWWTTERIEATVNQEYLERELGSKRHVDTLHSVLAFGDGLTDDTYLDWILEKSPRVFLILNQIGVPEKVFEATDRSLADDDLPLTQDSLWELNLFGGKSETLDKKFYREQFNFLIHELEPGGHVDYSTWEVVPVEATAKRPGIAAHPSSDRVKVQNQVYTRKKVATLGDNGIDEVHFLMQLKALTTIHHPHLISVWATYSQDDFNYILLTPPTEMTLKNFLDEPPKAFKALEKYERRNVFLTWTHCLTSALAYLHDGGFSHQTLRPSAITIDHKNTIYIGDYSAIKALDVADTSQPYSSELYDYSPPENWVRKPCLHETAALKTILPGGGRTARRIPKPTDVDPKKKLALPPPSPAPTTCRGSKSASSGSSGATRPRNAVITTFAPLQRAPSSSGASSTHNKRAYSSDVFSLTTIHLTLISMILQHTPKSFASFRCRLNRQAGRGNAPPDSSFHKNLPQVTKWIDMLAKEAGQREKKDMKFWGSIVELVQLCRLGIQKEAKDRIHTKDLEKKWGGWVDWGLGRKRKCTCTCGNPLTQPMDMDHTFSEEEPTSKYQLLRKTGYGHGKFKEQEKRKLSLPTDHSVDLGVGTVRPASISPHKDSTVWGLGDLSHLHTGMLRSPSVISTQDSMIWGSGEAPHFSPPSTPGARPTTSANENENGYASSIWGLGDIVSAEQPPPINVNMKEKINSVLEKNFKSSPILSHGRGLHQSHTRTQQKMSKPNTRTPARLHPDTHSKPRSQPVSQPRSRPDSYTDSNIGRGTEETVKGSEYSGDESETVRADWPLPVTSVGSLTLENRVRR